MALKNILNVYFAFTLILLISIVGDAHCVSIKLGWDPPSEGDVVGYKIYYGRESGSYTDMIDVGNTMHRNVLLKKGFKYYITVTAYNEFGESEPSNELLVNTCTYSLSSRRKTIKQSGGVRSVKVKTKPGCEWNATSGATWLQITDGVNGLGKGTITFSAEPNDTYEPRTAICTFAGRAFNVKQRGKKMP
jgi:hypothetical protein